MPELAYVGWVALAGLLAGAGIAEVRRWLRLRRAPDELAGAVLAGLVLRDRLRALEDKTGETVEGGEWSRLDAEDLLSLLRAKLTS